MSGVFCVHNAPNKTFTNVNGSKQWRCASISEQHVLFMHKGGWETTRRRPSLSGWPTAKSYLHNRFNIQYLSQPTSKWEFTRNGRRGNVSRCGATTLACIAPAVRHFFSHYAEHGTGLKLCHETLCMESIIHEFQAICSRPLQCNVRLLSYEFCVLCLSVCMTSVTRVYCDKTA